MFSKIKAVGRRAATVAAGTVLVLSQCLGSFGAAFAPSMAYADTSTKTATVTLADAENGSLSFVGRDDDTNSKKACRRCRKHVPSAGVGREKETGYPPIKTDPIVSKRRKHVNVDFQEHTKAGTEHERKLNHIERL